MSLIKSISGIRGTIGGAYNDNLTALDIVECTAAYGQLLKEAFEKPLVIVGRDGRISGKMVSSLVSNTLISMGCDVIDLGLSTTPTVEMAVIGKKAQAGVIITASHNPKHWNALKFLNEKGEFISAETGQTILNYIADSKLEFATIDHLGSYAKSNYFDEHIAAILKHEFVDQKRIKQAGFHVVVDCINSTGALSIPPLLDQLGVRYTLINEEVTGDFAHNPEPKIEHLSELSEAVISNKADMGIAVDPDVDRLAFMSPNGEMFGEEYTLVAIADYLLGLKKGPVVNNLSSTQALKDIAERHGVVCSSAAVGEVNVVNMMKKVNAIIGGEGNGGIIDPQLHYGRDALIGIALMLSHLAISGKNLNEIRNDLPHYEMIKDKIDLRKGTDVDNILSKIALHYKEEEVNTIDGVKIIFPGEWVHLRKSNTEPIIRIYAESKDRKAASELASTVKKRITELM